MFAAHTVEAFPYNGVETRIPLSKLARIAMSRKKGVVTNIDNSIPSHFLEHKNEDRDLVGGLLLLQNSMMINNKPNFEKDRTHIVLHGRK